MEQSRRGDMMAKREPRRISREERLKERKEKKRAREKQRKEAMEKKTGAEGEEEEQIMLRGLLCEAGQAKVSIQERRKGSARSRG